MVHSRLFRAAMLAAVASAGLVAGGLTQADAAPPALANQSFDLDYAAWLQSRNGLGTLDYTTDPGCGAGGLECAATATLNSLTGASAVSVDIGSAAAGGGDENYAQLYYYVQYNGSSPVVIHMSDSLNAGGPSADAQVYFGFGVAQLDPNGFPPLSSGILGYGVGPIGDDGSIIGGAIESLTDCASGSGYGRPNACLTGAGNYTSAAPLTNLNVAMQSGTWYLVDIWAQVQPADATAYAYLDPTFTAATGSFVFSGGVSPGIPESSTWAMVLAGFAGLAIAARLKSRRFSGRASAFIPE